MTNDENLIFEAYCNSFKSEDCENYAGEVPWQKKVNPTDHVEHGRRAAKWEMESGKKASNPHQPGTQEANDWETGYKQEKDIEHTEEDAEETDDERYDREASELENVMNQYEPDFRDTPFWDAYKAVKGGYWTENQFHQWAQSVWADGSNDEHHEGEEVQEKVKEVTKKQQALAGAVCNKRIGKHNTAAKVREFTKCMKGVEKSEVKYNYKPKKNK